MATATGTRVYLGNLPWSTEDAELQDLLTTVGAVVSVAVQRHADSSRSKGWAIAEFASAEDATNCVSTLDGHMFPDEETGRRLHVRLDREAGGAAAGGAGGVGEGGSMLFVGNVPWSTTEEELGELFAPYNAVDVHIKKNMAGRSRGFALCRFEQQEEAQSALDALNGVEIGGRVLEVRWDRGPGKAAVTEGRSIFVKNLPLTLDDDQLYTLFSECGTVSSARVQRTQSTNESRGWGLVEFENNEQAAAAIAAFNEQTLEGAELPLVVRLNRK